MTERHTFGSGTENPKHHVRQADQRDGEARCWQPSLYGVITTPGGGSKAVIIVAERPGHYVCRALRRNNWAPAGPTFVRDRRTIKICSCLAAVKARMGVRE